MGYLKQRSIEIDIEPQHIAPSAVSHMVDARQRAPGLGSGAGRYSAVPVTDDSPARVIGFL